MVGTLMDPVRRHPLRLTPAHWMSVEDLSRCDLNVPLNGDLAITDELRMGKKVLIWCDLNVPLNVLLNGDLDIIDETRITGLPRAPERRLRDHRQDADGQESPHPVRLERALQGALKGDLDITDETRIIGLERATERRFGDLRQDADHCMSWLTCLGGLRGV